MTDYIPNLLIQAAAGLIATILGGAFLYFRFEDRVRKRLKENENKRLLSNLMGDLLYNSIVSERIIKNAQTATATDKFTQSRYRTQGALDFLYARPLENKDNLYEKLSGLINDFEANNRLIDLVFATNSPTVIRDNKAIVIQAAPKIISKINRIFTDYEDYFKCLVT